MYLFFSRGNQHVDPVQMLNLETLHCEHLKARATLAELRGSLLSTATCLLWQSCMVYLLYFLE